MCKKLQLAIIALMGLFLVTEGLRQPTKRPDGSFYYPGRGCGINEPYKIISKLPEDTSNLKCVFYKPEALGRPLQPDMDICFYKGDVGSRVFADEPYRYIDNIPTAVDCQALCAKHVQHGCNHILWRVSGDQRCHLLRSYDSNSLNPSQSYVVAPRVCPPEAYFSGEYPKTFYNEP